MSRVAGLSHPSTRIARGSGQKGSGREFARDLVWVRALELTDEREHRRIKRA